MFRLAVGVVVGYVLGARAGRRRYEQIVKLSSKATDNPAVQAAAAFVKAKAVKVLPGKHAEPTRPDQAYLVDEPSPDQAVPSVG